MARELGTIEDQRRLEPYLIKGKSYRCCMRILGWPYGRVSEAARALKAMPSDSSTGRALRDRHSETKARTTAALRAQLEAYRARISS